MTTEQALEPIAFEQIEEALQVLGSQATAADSHGILCALFCANAALNHRVWVDSLLAAFVDHRDSQTRLAIQSLKTLFKQTECAFRSVPIQPTLLLPPDQTPLHQRMQALSEWCQGFLSGLKVLGVQQDNAPKALTPGLADLTRMACLHYDAEDSEDAEAEAAYSVLIDRILEVLVIVHTNRSALFQNNTSVPPDVVPAR